MSQFAQTVSRPAVMTSGTVNILDPLELMRQIRLISQNPVIATDVEVHFILHPSLMFDRNTDTSVGISHNVFTELAQQREPKKTFLCCYETHSREYLAAKILKASRPFEFIWQCVIW